MVKKIPFDSDKDIPDLSGKVIIVTGGNSGLGKETVLQLSKHNPKELYLGARSKARAEEAINDIKNTVPNANIKFLEMDISSLASVKKAADTFLAQNDRLDILVNNAGIAGGPAGLTEDGYETIFGTNHMGPALFTKLLLPIASKTASLPGADVRIVNLSSEAHVFGPKAGLLLSQLKTPLSEISGTQKYGQSKLANLYFTQSLANLYPNMKINAIHPGLVKTNLMSGTFSKIPGLTSAVNVLASLFFYNTHNGALPQLFAATGKASDVGTGKFYYPGVTERKASPVTTNTKLRDELWEWTEAELKSKGY